MQRRRRRGLRPLLRRPPKVTIELDPHARTEEPAQPDVLGAVLSPWEGERGLVGGGGVVGKKSFFRKLHRFVPGLLFRK